MRIYFKFLMVLVSIFQLSAFALDDKTRFKIPELDVSHLVLSDSSEEYFESKHLKLIVWNILKSKRENWSTDFLEITENADFLLLQEAYLNTLTYEVLLSLRNYRIDFGISFLYQKNDNIPTGTVLASKVNPLLSSILRSSDLEPYIGTPKTITYGYYPIVNKSQTVLVMNIHGLNVTKQSAFERQITDAFAIIAKHQGPVIFGGDFNTRSKNRMNFLRNLMQKFNLKEVPFTNDERMTVMGNSLDHVFVRNFKVEKATVLSHIKTSDHKPLYLDLVLEL